jgi:serine/threonine-protein kinase RsbW
MSSATQSPERCDVRMTCPLRRDNLVSEFCEVIPSTLDALNLIEERIMEVMKKLPCAPEDVLGVSLSLREALANAVLHGNQNNPAKRVLVACFCECGTHGGLLIVVRDEGAGFDLNAVPDPTGAEAIHSWHGRGIYLMRHFMDEISFAHEGSEVLLRKRRT